MKLERLLITCGGTGGHFYPGLAIAKAMQKRGGSVKLLLAGKHAASQQVIAKDQGVDSVLLPAVPPPRQAPFRFLAGVFQGIHICRREIADFAPNAVLKFINFSIKPGFTIQRAST